MKQVILTSWEDSIETSSKTLQKSLDASYKVVPGTIIHEEKYWLCVLDSPVTEEPTPPREVLKNKQLLSSSNLVYR